MSVHATCDILPGKIPGVALPRHGVVADQEAAEALDFRQLRHLSRNALQRILSMIAQDADLRRSSDGRALSDGLQQRILTAARLSDVLFGFVDSPGSLQDRLTGLSDCLVKLLGDDAATISVAVHVRCDASPELCDLLVRVAHELVGNAIKHGMHLRLLGDIRIEVARDGEQLTLTVSDDGWGTGSKSPNGQGLSIVDALLRPSGGSWTFRREHRSTIVAVRVPVAGRVAVPARLVP